MVQSLLQHLRGPALDSPAQRRSLQCVTSNTEESARGLAAIACDNGFELYTLGT